MALSQTLPLFIISCLVLAVSGVLLLKSLLKISRFLRMNEFVVSFVIMAFSTSIPELFVGINAALEKSPSIVLGTVIGSNIADLALVGGIIALLGRNIIITHKSIKKDVFFMVVIAATPIVLMIFGNGLSRLDGGILIGIFILYNYIIIKSGKRTTKLTKEREYRLRTVLYFSLFVLSLILLFGSSHYVVKYGQELALNLGLPLIFVGIFFVAIGTSLPELVFESTAVMKEHSDLAFGDLIGSVVANSTLVLGVSSLIYPIGNSFALYMISAMFMLVIAIIFMVFVQSNNRLTWREGIALLLLYVSFIIVELNIKGTVLKLKF